MLDKGKVRCWGINLESQLGLGNGDVDIGDQPGEMPPPDLNLGGNVAWMFPGPVREHSCAVFEDWSVRCWGNGAGGALGNGSSLDIGLVPEDMPPPIVPLIW